MARHFRAILIACFTITANKHRLTQKLPRKPRKMDACSGKIGRKLKNGFVNSRWLDVLTMSQSEKYKRKLSDVTAFEVRDVTPHCDSSSSCCGIACNRQTCSSIIIHHVAISDTKTTQISLTSPRNSDSTGSVVTSLSDKKGVKEGSDRNDNVTRLETC